MNDTKLTESNLQQQDQSAQQSQPPGIFSRLFFRFGQANQAVKTTVSGPKVLGREYVSTVTKEVLDMYLSAFEREFDRRTALLESKARDQNQNSNMFSMKEMQIFGAKVEFSSTQSILGMDQAVHYAVYDSPPQFYVATIDKLEAGTPYRIKTSVGNFELQIASDRSYVGISAPDTHRTANSYALNIPNMYTDKFEPKAAILMTYVDRKN